MRSVGREMTRVWQGTPGRKENEGGMERKDLGANPGYPGPPGAEAERDMAGARGP